MTTATPIIATRELIADIKDTAQNIYSRAFNGLVKRYEPKFRYSPYFASAAETDRYYKYHCTGLTKPEITAAHGTLRSACAAAAAFAPQLLRATEIPPAYLDVSSGTAIGTALAILVTHLLAADDDIKAGEFAKENRVTTSFLFLMAPILGAGLGLFAATALNDTPPPQPPTEVSLSSGVANAVTLTPIPPLEGCNFISASAQGNEYALTCER